MEITANCKWTFVHFLLWSVKHEQSDVLYFVSSTRPEKQKTTLAFSSLVNITSKTMFICRDDHSEICFLVLFHSITLFNVGSGFRFSESQTWTTILFVASCIVIIQVSYKRGWRTAAWVNWVFDPNELFKYHKMLSNFTNHTTGTSECTVFLWLHCKPWAIARVQLVLLYNKK